jgi:hypothetical protein
MASASATATLLNRQINYGAVFATAGFSAPLNGNDLARDSAIPESGNTVHAAAFGNASTNRVTTPAPGWTPGASIASLQVNYATVSAQAVQAHRVSGSMSSGSLAMSGNQVSASATGNQATSVIGMPR